MAAKSERRVVVTGLGVVSGTGTGADAFWDAVVNGRCSIDRVKNFDATDFKCQIGSEVLGFSAGDYFTNKKNVKSNDRVTHFAMAATRLALDDAGLEPAKYGDRCGVMVGSAFGGMETFEKQTLKLAASGPGKASYHK
ncbi:unnamed protein product [Phaeothamnion confervicola]